MKRTVSQLLRLRTWVYRIFGYAGASFVVAGFCLRVPEMFLLLTLLISGMIIYFSLHAHFNMLINERFAYVTSTLMDPSLIDEDNRCIHSKTSRYWGSRFSWYYYEATRLDICGEFREALAACESMPAETKTASEVKDMLRFRLLVRTGDLGSATLLANRIARLSEDKAYLHSCRLLLGEYNLEMGFLNKARELLTAVLPCAISVSVKLQINFNLARLHEKEGRKEDAMERYQETAALAPHTWMGQEAVRRLAALAQEEA